jgi:xylan 1,4-beta-xylosidase
VAITVGTVLSCLACPASGEGLSSVEELQPVHIVVNLSQRMGTWDPTILSNLGYDPIHTGTVDEALTDAWRQIKESRALVYVRCHNLFSDSDYGCRVYSEDESGKPTYDWTRLDRVLDVIVDAGVRPILECDFMPDALTEAPIVRNYGGGAINLPKDFGKWKNLVRELVLHCEKRYGSEKVRQWYFEVWNEPDVGKYWIGAVTPLPYENIVRFFKLYDFFAAGAKEADPHVRIGGPALGGCNIDYRFARYFLRHCVRGQNFATAKKEGAPIDFISWHAYGDLDYILDVNQNYARMIEEESPSLAKCERHLNEWGQPLGAGDNWPRTQNHYEAAFACALVHEVLARDGARVDLMLRWGGLTGEYFEGWRSLFTRVGSRTVPVALFNLYRLLGKMSSDRVKVVLNVSDRSAGAIATSALPNAVQILLWRFEEENHASEGPEREFTITVRGFHKRIRTVRSWRYLIDREHCDAWSEWNRMGKPKPATREQADTLFRKGVLSAAGEEKNFPVRREQAIITLALRPNSVCLLVLGKEGNPWQARPPAEPRPPELRFPPPLLP